MTYRQLCIEALAIFEAIAKHGPQDRLINRWIDELSKLEETDYGTATEQDRHHQYLDARKRDD